MAISLPMFAYLSHSEEGSPKYSRNLLPFPLKISFKSLINAILTHQLRKSGLNIERRNRFFMQNFPHFKANSTMKL